MARSKVTKLTGAVFAATLLLPAGAALAQQAPPQMQQQPGTGQPPQLTPQQIQQLQQQMQQQRPSRPLPPGAPRPGAPGARPGMPDGLRNRLGRPVDVPGAQGGTRVPAPSGDPSNASKHDDETESSEAENEEGAPKPINWTDFKNKSQAPYVIALLNFLVLAGIYWYFGRGPVARGLQARRDDVAKQIEEAQRMKEEAQERAKVYQAKLEGLESELAATKKALVEAGETERERIIHEAEARAERMTRDATLQIEQEMKQIRDDLRRETVEMAIAAAEELLQKRMTDDDQARLADEYLTELVAKTPRSNLRPPNPSSPSSPAAAPSAPSSAGSLGGAS